MYVCMGWDGDGVMDNSLTAMRLEACVTYSAAHARWSELCRKKCGMLQQHHLILEDDLSRGLEFLEPAELRRHLHGLKLFDCFIP